MWRWSLIMLETEYSTTIPHAALVFFLLFVLLSLILIEHYACFSCLNYYLWIFTLNLFPWDKQWIDNKILLMPLIVEVPLMHTNHFLYYCLHIKGKHLGEKHACTYHSLYMNVLVQVIDDVQIFGRHWPETHLTKVYHSRTCQTNWTFITYFKMHFVRIAASNAFLSSSINSMTLKKHLLKPQTFTRAICKGTVLCIRKRIVWKIHSAGQRSPANIKEWVQESTFISLESNLPIMMRCSSWGERILAQSAFSKLDTGTALRPSWIWKFHDKKSTTLKSIIK